jgi:hypothetical protein
MKYNITTKRLYVTQTVIEADSRIEAEKKYYAIADSGKLYEDELSQCNVEEETVIIDEPVKYARTCSVTGEGMDSGWVDEWGEMYFKYKKDAEAYCQEEWGQNIEEAHEEDSSSIYWTEWETEDEDTAKQEYFTTTEEMQHRMDFILEELNTLKNSIDNICVACDTNNNECLKFKG